MPIKLSIAVGDYIIHNITSGGLNELITAVSSALDSTGTFYIYTVTTQSGVVLSCAVKNTVVQEKNTLGKNTWVYTN